VFEAARTTRKRAHRAQPRTVWVPAPDVDFEWARRFLQARMVPAVEMITPDGLERVAWLDSLGRRQVSTRPVWLTIRYEPRGSGDATGTGACGRISISSMPAVPAATLRAAAVRMFDLDANLSTFFTLARRDSLLGPVVAANPRGLRLVQLLDPFEALLRAILGQQVSVAAASTMTDRLVRLVGTTAPRPPWSDVVPMMRPRFAFPRPGAVAQFGAARLCTIGLTRAKAASLHGAAVAVASGQLNLARLRRAAPDEADRQLLALPGVGPWTAAYVRLRALGDRDAFPAADLGLIRALSALGVPASRFSVIAERWRPWRGYATLHLWHSLGARARVLV
jgi:3-methyladenine DNA glycosylase/8-oxoguanine DNA glycosylase